MTYLRSSLLFCCLIALVTACNTPTNGTSDRANGEDTAVTDTDRNDMDPTTSDGPYTLTVLDTTIKSPRKELKGTAGGAEVTINYGSPSVNNRTIYGDLVPYGKVWRTGANEATRISFNGDVRVGAEKTLLSAGTYSLFTLPQDRDNWTVIFNKTPDQWGAYDYDEAEDAARIKGSSAPAGKQFEQMDFAIEGNDIRLMWADMMISFPVEAAAR